MNATPASSPGAARLGGVYSPCACRSRCDHRGDEQRNLDLDAVRELRRLHHLAGRIALDGGLRVLHFAHDRVRQLDGDRLAFVERELARDPVLEVLDRVAEVVRLDLVLVVFVVHEYVERIGEVGVGDFLLLELDDVELLVGAIDGLRPESDRRFFNFILTTDALRPDFVNSAFWTTIGSFPTMITLPARISWAIFIYGTCNAIRG
jgi:hypothetical protein